MRDIVYGPVKSRRLGQSLGINLTPLELKVCNFSCGYCRVGVPSKGDSVPEDFELYGWTLENVKRMITEGLEYHSREQTLIDYITIAGNGEPTLYPWFREIVDHLLDENRKKLQGKPTAIFTNATRLSQETSKTLYKIDRRFCKLDAGNEATFKRINMPLGVTYDGCIDNLLAFDDFELSMAIMDGDISNYDSFFNPDFLVRLNKMRFRRIFIYDIDIPKTISPRFNKKTDKLKLEKLADFLTKQTGREVIILWDPTTRECNIPLYPQQVN
ncbi:MAG: hypothetical protein ABIH37_05300 [archaeon]